MSSALDEDTRRAIDEGRETAGAMLRSAQKDLQKVFVVFLVGFIGSFYALRLWVWDFFKAITKAQMQASTQEAVKIIAQTPFDVILLQAKIGMVVGILFGLPVFIYFSRDALRERQLWPQSPVPAWKLLLLLAVAVGLFALGVFYGYTVFFPFTFAFLANNAIAVDFAPTYSIVKWAQFIFLLTLSFGLASQLPLVMSALSYAEIVPYETFRDKWRYAVVGIFAAGAMFTPPDPITQVLWAVPVLALYGVSLYVSKLVVTAKRGSEQIDLGRSVRSHWNLIAGVAVVGFLAAYGFFTRGGPEAVNDLLVAIGSEYRVPGAGAILPLAAETTVLLFGIVGALLAGVLAVMYFVYSDLEAQVGPGAATGDPAAIDLSELDVAGVRAAPPEAFAALSEEQAMDYASAAIDGGDHEKAQAILDRFDDTEDVREARQEQQEGGAVDEVGDRTSRATSTFLDEFTDGERDEDDIGGYYDDIVFILDSITSKSFAIAAVFGATLAVTFGWLYTGGIGRVFDDFLSRLPAQVTPEEVNVVALHPMEALIFEVKFSTLIAAIVTFPLIAYFAWPALRDRGFVRGRRRVVFGWTGALVVGLLGGFALGYSYVAPNVISYLAADAIAADMVIAYRITSFFWLIFFTTAGIGILADVVVLMVLLNSAGVPFRIMYGRWREVTVAMLAFAAVFTPATIVTMFLVTIPLLAAYAVGLGVLFVLTVGGKRDLGTPRWADI